MLTRCLIFLLCYSSFLTAQTSQQWQSYFHPNYFVGGVETMESRWLMSQNSLLEIDLLSGAETVHHHQNSSLPQVLLDIESTGPDEFVILGQENELLFWHSGQWERQILAAPIHIYFREIVGIDREGNLLLNSSREIYQLKTSGELLRLPYSDSLEQNYVQLAAVDQLGRTWVTGYPNLLCFDANGLLILDFDFTPHYPSSLAIDSTGNAWLSTNRGLYFWDNEQQELELVPQIGTVYLANGIIQAKLQKGIILRAYQQVLRIERKDNETFQITDVSTLFPEHSFPSYNSFQDRQDEIWYFDQYQQLRHWPFNRTEEPRIFQVDSWLPTGGLISLATDSQGKVWIGGNNQIAYLMGGRWNSRQFPSTMEMPLSVFGIVFNENDQPIISTGTQFFFGFPENQIIEYNGTSWDTLREAIISNSFNPLTDLKWDRDGNLWSLQTFNNIFSVRSQGEWFRFRASDMPGNVEMFTCFTEDPKGGMWIGTNDGLLFFDGFRFEHTRPRDIGITDATITSIAIDRDGIKWLSFGTGILRKQIDEEWIPVALPENSEFTPSVQKIICGNYPEMWASLNYGGILHFDGQQWEFWNTENSGLATEYISNMVHDPRGRTWFAGSQSISVYHGDNQSIEPFELSPEQSIQVYPNPGCCQYQVNWAANSPGPYQIQLFGLNGQLLREWEAVVHDTEMATFNFTDSTLPPGIYTIRVSQGKGEVGSTLLVMIR